MFLVVCLQVEVVYAAALPASKILSDLSRPNFGPDLCFAESEGPPGVITKHKILKAKDLFSPLGGFTFNSEVFENICFKKLRRGRGPS
eukprot:s527_g25.t1